MTQDYQAYLDWTYFGEEAYDQQEFERLRDILTGVTHFIDVGASHGVYSYHANRILDGCQITAVEADPERFEILRRNTHKWGKPSNSIRCLNAAASDELERSKSKTATFFVTGTQISGGLFPVAERSDNYRAIELPIVCVDDFFEPGRETFVKIDVEGSELRVLQGAVKHIASGKAKFFTELSWWGDRGRGTNFIDLIRFCDAHGLRVDRRLRSDYLISPEPSRSARRASYARSLRPLLIRAAWSTFVPEPIRLWRERRLLKRRIGRFDQLKLAAAQER